MNRDAARGELEGRVALIAGGAGEIGQAIVHELVKASATVVVADLDLGRAEQVLDAVHAPPARASALRLDVSSPVDCQQVVESVVSDHKRVDILVNAAGVQHIAPVHEFPIDQWDRVIRVNLTGAFLLMRSALPYMYANRWGRVVSLSSIHGVVASPNKPAYVAAKHGLVGLTRAAAVEAGEFGVTVNAVCPAYVRTKLVLDQVDELARRQAILPSEVEDRVMLGPTATKRFIEPEEVASFVRFLCAPSSGSITGVAHLIDGGWTAR